MKVVYHPEFPQDVRKFEAEYERVSPGLAARFRREVLDALTAIRARLRPPAISCRLDRRWCVSSGVVTSVPFRSSCCMASRRAR